jgi:hypothetical protein
MTSVGTRVRDAADPAAAPATMGAQKLWLGSTIFSTARLTGSYTAMKMADEGATPTRLPQTPAYRPRPPPALRSAW